MATPISLVRPRIHLLFRAAFPSLAGIALLFLSLSGSSSPNHTPPFQILASSAQQGLPIEIRPDPISLGTLDPGQSAVAKFTLRNPGSHPVIVARVETSCPCLKVVDQPTSIGPGQAADLTVKFDPTNDPDFRGGLSIDVIGRDPMGRIVFQTRAKIEVGVQLGEPAESTPDGPGSNPE